MKLTKIKIINFGQFSNFTFDLTAGDLTVFFGANEAGKSTIVAFVKQVMFGFHLAKHSSDFFEDYQPLARVSTMGGSLFFASETGDDFELERLYASGKGSKLGTLTVKRNGQVVPEAVFFDQIKNIDGDFYADSFIFNQDMLAKVFKLQQTDLLERIYYLGASNSDQLIDLRADFAKKASALFKKSGTNPPLNRLLKQLKAEEEEVNESAGEFTDYQELAAKLQEQKKLLAKLESELADLQKKYKRIDHLKKLLPTYRKLTDLKGQVEQVNFDPDHFQTTQTVALQVESLREDKRQLQTKLDRFGQERAGDTQAENLLQKKPELLQWQAEYRTCREQEQQIEQEKQQLLTLEPALAKIIHLDQAAIIDLQREYQELPQKAATPVPQSNISPIMLLAGGALVVVGLVLLAAVSKVGGAIVLATGIASLAYGLARQKQDQESINDQQAKQKKVAARRATFTAKYGLEGDFDLHNLVNQWRQYQLQEQKQQHNRQREKDLLDQLNKVAIATGHVLHQPVTNDFAAVLTAFEQLEQQQVKDRRQLEQQASLHSNLQQTTAKLHDAGLKLKAALAQAQVESMADYQKLQSKQQDQAALSTKIAIMSATLNDDLPQLTQLQQHPEQATNQLVDLAKSIADHQTKVRSQQDKIAEIKVKMNNLANSTAVFAAQQTLANTKTKFQNLSADYLANLVAARWIERALDLASNERFPKMLAAAKEYLRLLTNNRYNSIEIAQKLTVTRADGKKIKVQYLSRGTSEQLYFALKLAFVQQIKNQINLPVLIDDSFVDFDDQRTDQIKQLLEQVATSNQVLIFTAQASLVDKLQLQPLTFTKGTKNV
ncbi:ATP-binding protein [Lactobacillus xylocopicola]|uniref:DNA repair ATPase n=1 Tax=Lactobacillus xylocopicola TaxID=2976676 RepID=A0ABN6SKD7_9LACO|nr:AAA family ATPase [Lactobacillus xylocopicola]BDR60760.1 DNA repair ATPase [Lactobacillus xylocopicola]